MGIVTRAQPAAEMHCGHHVSLSSLHVYLGPSSALSLYLFFGGFFVNVSLRYSKCLHSGFSSTVDLLPDTSISPFQRLSTPDLSISAVGTLLLKTQHSSLGCHDGFSYPIQSSRPARLSAQETTAWRDSFVKPQLYSPTFHHSVFLMQIVVDLGKGKYIRKIKLSPCSGTLVSMWEMCYLWHGQTDSVCYLVCSFSLKQWCYFFFLLQSN